MFKKTFALGLVSNEAHVTQILAFQRLRHIRGSRHDAITFERGQQ